MAFAFPLNVGDFFAGLAVQTATFDLPESLQVSGRTAGGSVLTAGIGARLWSGSVQLPPMYREDADAVLARLSILREPGRHLFVHPFPGSAPRDDPRGNKLGSASPVIRLLNANSRDMALSGLPAGYVLSQGDGLAFAYATNPMRYAYHRIVSARVVAASNGQTPLFEVTPHIRQGAVIGSAVALIRPTFKALILPGSVNVGMTGPDLITRGISFDIQQTLR